MSIFQQTQQQMTKQAIIEAPESDYMNELQLAFFQEQLRNLYDTTCERIKQSKQQMQMPSDASDEHDRASWEEQCMIAMRIVDREQKLLIKIKQSLKRIRLKTYGYCLDTGEPIGIQRLLLRPTAEYCTDVKALKEWQEYIYQD